MKHYWIIFVLIISCLASSYATYLYLNLTPYRVERASTCFSLSSMMDKLKTDFGETLLFIGYNDFSDHLHALVYNSTTGSWTWLSISNQDVACVLYIGEIGIVN
jgi:hypothetical protein